MGGQSEEGESWRTAACGHALVPRVALHKEEGKRGNANVDTSCETDDNAEEGPDLRSMAKGEEEEGEEEVMKWNATFSGHVACCTIDRTAAMDPRMYAMSSVIAMWTSRGSHIMSALEDSVVELALPCCRR